LSDNLKIEPLGKKHDRAAFSCGNDSLDQYLKNQAGQAVDKNLAAVFVLTSDGKKIAGYYTLSSYAVNLDEIPEEIARRLTRIQEVPATLLGRLARSVEFRGQGVGEILLVDALKRAVQNRMHVASWQSSLMRKTRKLQSSTSATASFRFRLDRIACSCRWPRYKTCSKRKYKERLVHPKGHITSKHRSALH